MAATVYAVCNQKGGCAKTVTSVSFGIGLARSGKRVLLIDMDAQGSLSASLGYQQPDKLEVTLADILGGIINDTPLPEGYGIPHSSSRYLRRSATESVVSSCKLS